LEPSTVVVHGGTETASSEAGEAYRVTVLAHLQQLGTPVLLTHLGQVVPRPPELKKKGPGEMVMPLGDIFAGDARFQVDGSGPSKILSLAGPAGSSEKLFNLNKKTLVNRFSTII